MNDIDEFRIEADDLASYLSDNALWVDTYALLGLFGEAAAGYEPGKRAPKTYCPIHGGRSGEAFGFLKSGSGSSDMTGVGWCNSCRGIGGFKAVMGATGWSFGETLKQLAIASGYAEGILTGQFQPREKSPEQIERERQQAILRQESDRKNMETNRQLWSGAYMFDQAEAEPMRRYFEHRGIFAQASMFGDEVRYHPGVFYSHTSKHPCIITKTDEEGVRYYWMDDSGVTAPAPTGNMMDNLSDINRRVTHLSKSELAKTYLDGCPQGLRELILESNPVFHPGIYFIQRYGKHPCILTRIRNSSGTPVNLHQTFITLDGKKADLPQVKKVRPKIHAYPMSGGAAQLALPGPCMSVAEGLETVGSVGFAIKMPIWGLLNATMMGSWIPPIGTKKVYIWEDPDEAGESNAALLSARLKDMGIIPIRVSTKTIRPEGDMDWNEILNNFGATVFPHQDWLEAA